jgi:chromosomal replication initiation ATPase DnaA
MKAAELRALVEQAETQEAEETLRAVAKIVGIGETDLVSRDRRAETVRRRGVVAWILVDRLKWPIAKAARHLQRTERQLYIILRAERRG